MAQVTTIDITGIEGSATFPLNVNGVYDLVETIASQNIRAVKSVNPIEDAFFEYDVKDGSVIEEAIIEMAKKQAFVNTGAPDLKPLDPKLYVKYFNNWEKKQFQATTRITDIRNIIANKGVGFEEVISQILATLSEGEGYEDLQSMMQVYQNIFQDDIFDDAGGVLFGTTNRKPANAKGIIYCAREMYNALKSTNTIGGVPTAQATPVEDIRIAIPESILNLLDVVELANVFNLSKEELFGKLVVLPRDDTHVGTQTTIFVYDRKALGRGTRLFEYSQDKIGKGLYTNHYLTTDRIYFVNNLFKGLMLNCYDAVEAEKAKLLA